jgi:hypothetical protein
MELFEALRPEDLVGSLVVIDHDGTIRPKHRLSVLVRTVSYLLNSAHGNGA